MKDLICIVCPNGCPMKAEQTKDGIRVEGNRCKRGEAFAKAELTRPMRTVCSTVKTVFPEAPVLPVRVSAEIPKERIFDVMKEIGGVVVATRVSGGDVIIKNVLNLNVDVIATSGILREAVSKVGD